MMRRWASSDYFLFLLLFPFPLRLDWRPMVYFCRTKQPTKENSWILAFLVIFVLRHPPPPIKKENPKSDINLPTIAGFQESLGKCYRGLLGSALFMFLSCVSCLSSTHGSVLQQSGLGSSKPEGNKQEKSCSLLSLKVCVPGASTGCTTLVALPVTLFWGLLPLHPLGGMPSVFGIIVYLSIPLLSTCVQAFLNSTWGGRQ